MMTLLLTISVAISQLLFAAAVCANETATSQSAQFVPVQTYHLNCGVNVAYVTLRLFNRIASLKEVSQTIGAGFTFERNVSLLDLKTMFVASGLVVEGFKADQLEEMADFAKVGDVLVVRVEHCADQQIGHFVVLKPTPNWVILIDPPYRPRALAKKDLLKDPVLSRATGEFLVVSESQDPSLPGPAIVLDRRDIDLGSIPLTSGEVVGEIKFKNVGTEVLKIRDLGGSCGGCLSRFSGDRELLPAEKGILMVVFDKRKLPPGNCVRRVNLVTNDPNNEVVTVDFRFVIQGEPEKKDIRLLPQLIDYGRVRCGQIAKGVVALKLVMPRDRQGNTAIIEVETTTPLLRITQTADQETEDLSGYLARVVMYELSWADSPRGRFEEKVHFRIGQKEGNDQIVTFLVRGDAVLTREHPVPTQ